MGLTSLEALHEPPKTLLANVEKVAIAHQRMEVNQYGCRSDLSIVYPNAEKESAESNVAVTLERY